MYGGHVWGQVRPVMPHKWVLPKALVLPPNWVTFAVAIVSLNLPPSASLSPRGSANGKVPAAVASLPPEPPAAPAPAGKASSLCRKSFVPCRHPSPS